jgi:hypothetical protein
VTYRRASLDEKLAHGRAVVHCVEGGDLVDAHGGHLEQAGDLVHDADAGEAVLALAEVEQGHDGGLFVLGRVALEDLGDELLVLGVELEGQVGVVVGCVSVLFGGRDTVGSEVSAFWSSWICPFSGSQFCLSLDTGELARGEATVGVAGIGVF